MIFILLLAYTLAEGSVEIPESGFGTPTYLVDLGIIGHVAVPCIFACMVLLMCYPNPKVVNYQMALASVAGICLGLHHMILGALPSGMQNIILILTVVIVCVLSFRSETRALVISISNTYLGGYLVLMLLGVKYKFAGIPIMVVYGLIVYFIISAIETLFVSTIRATSCTFFFLSFLAPLGLDAFNNMLSYSFYKFDMMRIISTMITVGAFVFFFCLPFFIDVILIKLNSSLGTKQESTAEKDAEKTEV